MEFDSFYFVDICKSGNILGFRFYLVLFNLLNIIIIVLKKICIVYMKYFIKELLIMNLDKYKII